MNKLSLTLTTALVCLCLGALLAPAASALDKQAREAVAAADWDRVVELVGPTLQPGADIPAKMLMMQACRASNRNNSAERQLDVEPNPTDRVGWLDLADSLRADYPESPAVLALWGDARYRARKDKEHSEHAVSESLASVSRAIELDKNFAFAYKIRGDIYLAEHRNDHALADYQKATELAPKVVEARYCLGIAYEKKEQYEQAIEEYTEALALSPGFAKALTFRGAVYRELDSINQAIEDCNAALEADPTYVMAHFVKAMAYYQADMKQMATNCFKEFIASAPPKLARMARNAQARIMMIEESM